MLNYMRAELYKVFHRKYLYWFLIVMVACEGLLISGWVFTNSRGSGIDFSFGASMLLPLLSGMLYMVLLIADMVFSDQYKFNTLKNEVSFGLSRNRIFLGKLAVEMILGVVLSLLLTVFYVGACYVTLLPSTGEAVSGILSLIGYCYLVTLPQWLGLLAMTHMIFSLVRSNGFAAFAAAGVIFIPQMVFQLMGVLVDPFFNQLEVLMPGYLVDGATKMMGDWGYLATSWAMGGFWLVLGVAIGLTCFRKREIS